MNKLVKRILALALVVCMLLGTMVIPTFATEPDVEAAPIVYDFTTLTQTATAAQGAKVMWAYEGDYDIDGDGQRLYGFGHWHQEYKKQLRNGLGYRNNRWL